MLISVFIIKEQVFKKGNHKFCRSPQKDGGSTFQGIKLRDAFFLRVFCREAKI